MDDLLVADSVFEDLLADSTEADSIVLDPMVSETVVGDGDGDGEEGDGDGDGEEGDGDGEEEDLDTSWIETAEFQDNYEREHIKETGVFFVYVDVLGLIEKITKEYLSLDDGEDGRGIVSKDQLLHIIQTKRSRTDSGDGKKYRFLDLLMFHVPLEPGDLDGFVKGGDRPEYLKRLPIFDDIVFDPSIFIFHDLTGLFFIFKEIDQSVAKSILKNSSDTITRKIRGNPNEYIEKKRKSMKRMLRRLKMTRKNM